MNAADIAAIAQYDPEIAGTRLQIDMLLAVFDLAQAQVVEVRLADGDYDIYPNPVTSSAFYISSQLNNSNFTIYNALGKKIMQGKCSGIAMEITTTNLSPGIYFVCILNNNAQYIQKLIVE